MPVCKLETLDEIISSKELYPEFQPIFEFSKPEINGYEALIRGPADSELQSPVSLFETARKYNRISALENVCREISCEYFATLELPGKLFLNISPMSYIDNTHKNGVTTQILDKHEIAAEKIVIALSEQYPIDDYEIVTMASEHYRKMGFQIAMDGLGTGYSGLKIWSEIRPDYVKVDQHFIENINESPVNQEFVRSIYDIARGLNCIVIAEGIEIVDELEVLKSIGINYGQGYLLGRPNKVPVRKLPKALLNRDRSSIDTGPSKRMDTVGRLVDHSISILPTMSIEEVADLFKRDQSMHAYPVVNDSNVPIGIITRNKIQELFLGRYGRDLFAKKDVKEYMEKPIIVSSTSPIQDVSRMITENNEIDISMDFIIVRNNQYLGAGKVRNLLASITEMQIRSARYSNPLTLLPGNVPIHEFIDNLFQYDTDFVVAYFDINDFKPFNDRYGYSCGDEVILKVSEIIQRNVDHQGDLIGHIGGDDFVIIFTSQGWKDICQRILKDFEQSAPEFYSSEERLAGGIKSVDRRGKQQFFPMISLAVGVVLPDRERCVSHHDVASLASDAKSQAKRIGGNTLFVSRRRGKSDIEYSPDSLAVN